MLFVTIFYGYNHDNKNVPGNEYSLDLSISECLEICLVSVLMGHAAASTSGQLRVK